MYRVSKQPSAKVIGLRRRLKKEQEEIISKKALIQAMTEEIKIIAPKDYEGDPPDLAAVLEGKVKASLMFKGKFTSKDAVQATMSDLEESIIESYGVIREIQGKLKKFTD